MAREFIVWYTQKTTLIRNTGALDAFWQALSPSFVAPAYIKVSCSECVADLGGTTDPEDAKKIMGYKFCPYCGAKLDEE